MYDLKLENETVRWSPLELQRVSMKNLHTNTATGGKEPRTERTREVSGLGRQSRLLTVDAGSPSPRTAV
jgi:hypothetical protein